MINNSIIYKFLKDFPNKHLLLSIKESKVLLKISHVLAIPLIQRQATEALAGCSGRQLNPVNLEAEFSNGVGSIPIAGNSSSIGG